MEKSSSEIRKAWHRQKFQRVAACLPQEKNLSILDIGCFAGTFLSLLPKDHFSYQMGIDIVSNQITYAKKHYETEYRKFQHVSSINSFHIDRKFDCITLIEVIEHLHRDEVRSVLEKSYELLNTGGHLVITTPNYISAWPLVEWLIDHFSEVNYEEQHVTKFHYFNIKRKLKSIYPLLPTHFRFELLTSIHFISPFLAYFSPKFSDQTTKMYNPQVWHFPFGNLLMISIVKK